MRESITHFPLTLFNMAIKYHGYLIAIQVIYIENIRMATIWYKSELYD